MPVRPAVLALLAALAIGGCSFSSQFGSMFEPGKDDAGREPTGSLAAPQARMPSEKDLDFARAAAAERDSDRGRGPADDRGQAVEDGAIGRDAGRRDGVVAAASIAVGDQELLAIERDRRRAAENGRSDDRSVEDQLAGDGDGAAHGGHVAGSDGGRTFTASGRHEREQPDRYASARHRRNHDHQKLRGL